MSLFPKQAANSLVTETLQYFVFFCRSDDYAILAKCLIINVLRLIIVILFFIAFLNITYVARHTWATTALRQNYNSSLICDAMGHSSVKVTETYFQPYRDDEVNRMNSSLITYILSKKKRGTDKKIRS
ncbi:integrase [Bacteroides fragilis]